MSHEHQVFVDVHTEVSKISKGRLTSGSHLMDDASQSACPWSSRHTCYSTASCTIGPDELRARHLKSSTCTSVVEGDMAGPKGLHELLGELRQTAHLLSGAAP
eukprot:5271476-Amphidinium_carterae.2